MLLTLAILGGGREYILSLLAADPTWLRTTRKSPEGAASLMAGYVKQTVIDEARALILPEIQHFYEQYVRTNGPKPGLANGVSSYGDWEEGLDDGLLNLFEPYASVLSASWLQYTASDCALWQEDEAEKLATSFANEVWKQFSWQRSDNQILSGVGIVHDDLAVYGQLAPEPVKPPQPEFSQMAINAILNRIMLNMPDPTSLADDLDFASDDDDLLALGAAQRMGITMEDVAMLRAGRRASAKAVEAWQNAIEAGELLDETKNYADMGEPDQPKPALPPPPVNTLAGQLKSSLPPLPPPPVAQAPQSRPSALPPLPAQGNGGSPVPPPPVATGSSGPPPANTGRGGKRTKTPETAPDGAILAETLRKIKDSTGVKDEEFAELMGISRPTLNNVMKGKTWYVPADPTRREALRGLLMKHAQSINEAYAEIGQ